MEEARRFAFGKVSLNAWKNSGVEREPERTHGEARRFGRETEYM